MTRTLRVAVKTWREMLRDRKTLALTLGLPMAFMLIFGLAFGDDGPEAYEVAAVNQDEGNAGRAYLDGLANLTYEGGGHILVVGVYATVEEARDALQDGDADIGVLVPPGFTAGLAPATRPGQPGPLPVGDPPQEAAPPAGAEVALLMDPSSQASNAAAQAVDAYTQAFAAQASGQPPLVRLARESVAEAGLTGFDFLAPGLMVFAILNLAPQAAALLARESERRTLDRLKLTTLRAGELLAGVSLAQMGVGALAILLMFGTALAMGFDPAGHVAAGILIALATAVSVIGVGMVIAAFAKKQDDAANLGVLFSVPASFLSGAFFPIPTIDLFDLGGRTVTLYDALPPTHAIRALRAVLTLGQDLGDVAFELAALGILSLLYLALGAALYARRRMRAGT